LSFREDVEDKGEAAPNRLRERALTSP